MNRPWQIAAAFSACLAVILAAMGWLSHEVLRLEAEARRQGLAEENVRLALWRMESALAPLVAQENARPYAAYCAFYSPELPHGGMTGDWAAHARPYVFVPSPILVQASPYVRLHFQYGSDGRLSSPQVPGEAHRERAAAAGVDGERVASASAMLARLEGLLDRGAVAEALRASPAAPPAEPVALARGPAEVGQQARNVKEWQARAQQAAGFNVDLANQLISNRAFFGDAPTDVMRPVWLGGELVLVRRVGPPMNLVQGAWLDWPALRSWLVAGVRDLLPGADLVPVGNRTGEDPSRRLAALPLRLVPGAAPVPEADGLSPTAVSLAVAWGAALLAAAAVGVLLWGTVALSQRRADFVSAVTHELRTPLTTFRMYSEMLHEGMVADEAGRTRYLATLRAEAERLSHLVENVLAYARLERGRARGHIETVALADLAARCRDRLAGRADQADMVLEVEVPAEAEAVKVRADASAVEQVLFNLVDNAAKYAAGADDRRIHLSVGRSGRWGLLKVADHGSGVSPEGARRLFRPFSKSAREAAESKPGVGLGLALARRLAREMGGNLALDGAHGGGACFVLTLPMA